MNQRRSTSSSAPRKVALATGSGSHGAFTWGVLDRMPKIRPAKAIASEFLIPKHVC
jgi:hypothetical protein